MTPFFALGARDKLAALSGPQIAGLALAAGSGTLAVYDLLRTRGLNRDVDDVTRAMTTGRRVDAQKFVHKIDPDIKVVTRSRDVDRVLGREKSLGDLQRAIIAADLKTKIDAGDNAAALAGTHGPVIFVAPRAPANVLGHEIGHVLDFRARGKTIADPEPISSRMAAMFWRPAYERGTMAEERRAWELSPTRRGPTGLETAALGTYDKRFHAQRGAMAGVLSSAVVSVLLSSMIKTSAAENRQSSDAQNVGEAGVDEGAPGISGHLTRLPREQVVSKSRRHGRGVPETLRLSKFLRSPATWASGDTIGARG